MHAYKSNEVLLRHSLRHLAVAAEHKTAEWVVPAVICDLASQSDSECTLNALMQSVNDLNQEWGSDPELDRLRKQVVQRKAEISSITPWNCNV